MGLMDKPPDPLEDYKNMPWMELEHVSREEWGAKPPTSAVPFDKLPVREIILGYTETETCDSKETCIKLMQDLQTKHMAEGHTDIRFSYVVGLDNRVYEGRGFRIQAGEHPRYPALKGISVEVVLTGERGDLPNGENSWVMYRLLDVAAFEDGTIEFDEPMYTLDYDDPPTDYDNMAAKEVDELNKISRPILAPFAEEYRRKYGDY
uniref:Peptidoglycan recognition protein 4 n=1 Tax=Nephotettix cincticeps TaxID=94400 RepID=A0A5H2X8Q7_NEPCI|nr:peptidoglycan recognition protein 4 [Nephotettix cincticeps]